MNKTKGFTAEEDPIGSVLVLDGGIIGLGHNQRVQKGSCILHVEMDYLIMQEDLKRLTISG